MGHVVKAKERAEVKRYGGRLHHLSFNRSFYIESLSFSVYPAVMLTSCPALKFSFFSSFFWGLEKGRPLPPLRTTTLIQTRAPQQLHTQELGFCRMQLATISNACAKQKENWQVRSRTRGWTVCREPERPAAMERERGWDHVAHKASHLDTLRSEKSHRFLKVPVTIFFVLEVVVFYTVLIFYVPQWHFTNTFLTVLKISSSFGFWLTDLVHLVWFLHTKSL